MEHQVLSKYVITSARLCRKCSENMLINIGNMDSFRGLSIMNYDIAIYFNVLNVKILVGR